MRVKAGGGKHDHGTDTGDTVNGYQLIGQSDKLVNAIVEFGWELVIHRLSSVLLLS
jgi:hypothetical protein